MKLFNESQWADEQVFKSDLTRYAMDEHTTASGVPLCTDKNGIFVDTKDSHTLIFGSTGSKKTRNFVIPSVYSLGMAGESMIISDPKGEIYKNTSGFLAAEGYQILTINLRNPEYGTSWNPLLLPYRFYKAGDKDRSVEMVIDFCEQLKAIVHSDKDVFWENVACDMFVGLIMMLFECVESEEEVHIRNVEQLRLSIHCEQNGPSKGSNSFWTFYESFPNHSIVKYKLSGLVSVRSTDRTFSGIMTVFDTMIGAFLLQEKLMDLMSGTDLIYEDMVKGKTALYLIIPDEKQTYHFLVSVFVKQCYEYFIYYAQKQPKFVLPIRVNFILDEFSNITRIRDMSAMISAARSRNMRFILIVQSKQQLYTLYDKEANVICSNCRNWVYLPCRELELLKEIQQLCGETFIENRGYIPLVSLAALQQLKIGWEYSQALILRLQMDPFIAQATDFSLYPQSQYEQYPMTLRKRHPVKHFNFMEYINTAISRKAKEVSEELKKSAPTDEDWDW